MTVRLPVAALPDPVARLHRKGAPRLDLVGQRGGNSSGKFYFTPDIADIAAGWTETRSVKNKEQKWEFQMIKEVNATSPFGILGINSDDRSQFINLGPFRWCAHTYWHVMRQGVGCDRYRTPTTRFNQSSPVLDRSASPRKPGSTARTNHQDRPRSSDRSQRFPRIRWPRISARRDRPPNDRRAHFHMILRSNPGAHIHVIFGGATTSC